MIDDRLSIILKDIFAEVFSRLKHDTCKKVQSTGRSISEHFPDWKCLSFNILWGISNFSYDIKIDKR